MNVYPFPLPSGIPRKQGFMSVDPQWLFIVIQNAPWIFGGRSGKVAYCLYSGIGPLWGIKSHQNVSLNASLITASYCPRFHQLGMPLDEWIFFLLIQTPRVRLNLIAFFITVEWDWCAEGLNRCFGVWNSSRGKRSCFFSQALCVLSQFIIAVCSQSEQSAVQIMNFETHATLKCHRLPHFLLLSQPLSHS